VRCKESPDRHVGPHNLVKESRQLRDKADVLIRGAEVAVEETRLTCPRCSQPLSPDDSVVVASDGRVCHLDCRTPRALNGDERFALICYCFDHAVASCAPCGRAYREIELVTDYVSGRTHLCPYCRGDLTESIRAHLYACAMLPEEVRKRARAARETAQRLVKQSRELADRADVLMREVEVTIAKLRETWRRSEFRDPDALQLLVRLKLANGRLPHEDIPPTISGGPGDGSICGACDDVVTPGELMMMVTTSAPRSSTADDAPPIPLHADCFWLWDQERHHFKSGR
jgi:hypothetical protein